MLFTRIVFREGPVLMELEDCVAGEGEGLLLALTVAAAAMNGKNTVDEWGNSLSLMKPSYPSFPHTHAPIDQELYQRLRWRYDALPHSNVKNCFLCCAMFPEDAALMWTN